MYINIVTSKLLTLIHYTHIEIFLKEVEIITTEINVTFEEYDEVFQYDLKDASNKLDINKDWKPRNQITIDQRKKQLEQ